jgi:DNA-binding transcriptional regulator YdaS (Cro superfamily)
MLEQNMPSLSEWLKQALAEFGIRQASLARELGINASRVNEWCNGKEKIPREFALEIARIVNPYASHYVRNLHDIQTLIEQLQHGVPKGYKATCDATPPIKNARLKAAELLCQRALNLRWQERLSNEAGSELLITYLIDANYLADSVFRMLIGHQKQLFTSETIGRHLRHPMADFMAVLLNPAGGDELAEFRHLALGNLRGIAKTSARANAWVHEASLFALAMSGQQNDRDMVSEVTKTTRGTERGSILNLAGMGFLIQKRDRASLKRFLVGLHDDYRYLQMYIYFQYLYYGHVGLLKHFSHRSYVRHVIQHLLRRIEHPAEYHSVAELDYLTLIKLISLNGPRIFTENAIAPRLENVIETGMLDCLKLRRLFVKEATPLVAQRRTPRIVSAVAQRPHSSL